MYEQLNKLEKGKKITIVSNGGFGATKIHATVENIRTEKSAQYERSHLIIYKEPRKRKLSGFRINEGSSSNKVYIYEGHIEFDNNGLTAPRSENGMMVTSSKYGCFDDRYFTDAISLIKDVPLIMINGVI
jgi:hypothetical protein